jgi:nucleoside-diphosphate-sugar epimerase
MRVLVIGANGMAGHVIVKYLKNQGNTVVTVARNNADYLIDIENTESVKLLFSNIEKDCKQATCQ